MYKKILLMICCILLSVFLSSLCNPPLPVHAASQITNATSWLDHFDSTILNNRWTWVREDKTHWTLASQTSCLTLTTQGDWIWGTANGNTEHNLLITPAPEGDFQITTLVTFNPSVNFQGAGLLIYQDDDNYLKLHRVFANGNYVEFIQETAGSVGVVASQPVTATTVYLRIEKDGTSYYATFSLNGTNWTPVGVTTSNLISIKVGLDANNDLLSVPEIPANFDFFQMNAPQHLAIPAPWIDHFNNSALSNQWWWIREDQSHWSLAMQYSNMTIITQADLIWGTSYGNTEHNLLLATAPNGDFQITTKLTINPSVNFPD